MGLKRDEAVSGCFAKAADDEPLFVLRATDKLAPAAVAFWISLAKRAGTPEPKLAAARELLAAFEKYQAEHGCKVPD